MNARQFIRDHRFSVFAAFVIVLGAATILAVDAATAPYALVLIPTVAAFATAALAGQGDVSALVARITRWRVRPVLYLAALGIPLVATLLMVAGAVATGSPMSAAFSDLSAAALVVPLVVLLPALLEEIGWRGYGIPALGKRPLIVSAALVGVLFVGMHIPLHLPGYLYADVPVWPTILSTGGYAILVAWIFAAGRGSVLLAFLMHGAFNAFTPLTWGIDATRIWEMRGIVVAVLAVIVLFLARRMFMAPLSEDTEAELVVREAPATV